MSFTQYAEFRAGKAAKFYEITVEATPEGGWRVVAKWGRIGTAGQTKEVRRLAPRGYAESYAVREAQSKMEDKLKKGYKLVTPLESLAGCADADPPLHIIDVEHRDWTPVGVPGLTADQNEKITKALKVAVEKLGCIARDYSARKMYYDVAAKQVGEVMESFYLRLPVGARLDGPVRTAILMIRERMGDFSLKGSV